MDRKYGAWIVVGMGGLQGFLATVSPALSSPPPVVESVTAEDAMKTVLTRPLFAPDRRPDASAAQPDSLPMLTGIVHYEGREGALFQGAGIPAGRLVRSGEVVAGWTVIAVTRETVTLERDGQRIVQRPDFQHHLDADAPDHPAASEKDE